MQFKMQFERRSEEEYIKDQGLVIDYDEIARKGKMSKEEALISKWYGVYQSRQQGNHMARIVVPGGRITPSQARKIAEVSDTADLHRQPAEPVAARRGAKPG